MLRSSRCVRVVRTVFNRVAFACASFPLGPADSTAARELLQHHAADQIATQLVAERYDLVYERYSLWSGQALVRAARLGIPSILEVNAPLIEEQAEHRELVQGELARAVRDQVFLAATTIVAVSDCVAQYVKSHLPETEHSKVHVVPNGVDIDRFRPTFPPNSPDRHFTIGFLGTLKPWHGLESLLSAFEILHRHRPDAILRIIGDGPTSRNSATHSDATFKPIRREHSVDRCRASTGCAWTFDSDRCGHCPLS